MSEILTPKEIADKFTHRRDPYDGFYKDLSNYLQMDENHPKLKTLWEVAWQEKHCYGVEETVWFCQDLLELIK